MQMIHNFVAPLRKFKENTRDLLFTCGTTVPELTGNKNLTCLDTIRPLLGMMPAAVSVGQKKT